MTTNALFAFLHFVAAFGVIFSLFFEWVTFNKNLTLVEAKRIQKIDTVYGVTAGLVLIIGFLRLFYFEKGSDFYFGNPFYYVKLYIFLVVGILSIYPTVCFIKWRKKTEIGEVPDINKKEFKIIKWILRLEAVGLLLMILSASFMAKGIGYTNLG